MLSLESILLFQWRALSECIGRGWYIKHRHGHFPASRLFLHVPPIEHHPSRAFFFFYFGN